VLMFLLSALVPAAFAADPTVVIKGLGSARALDLSIPLLNQLPALGKGFSGLTAGLTSTEFSGLTNSIAKGQAIGNCSLLGSDLTLPQIAGLCSGPGVEQSEANTAKPVDGDGVQSCVGNLAIAIVKLVNSCANSISKIEGGRPGSLNSAGVLGLDINLDLLQSLLTGLGVSSKQDLTSNAPVVKEVTGVVTSLLGASPKVAPEVLNSEATQKDLTTAVTDLLGGLVDNLSVAKLINVKAGLANTDLTNSGVVTSVVSQAAGADIGLLGLTDALKDGLIVIEVGVAKALVNWNDADAKATAEAVPAIAKVKVKDLLGLGGGAAGSYLTLPIEAPALTSGNGLEVLKGTPLETTIELAHAATDTTKPNAASAKSSGVAIHALKGIGASSLGKMDGGLLLRVASADAAIGGDIVKPQQVPPSLPVTGGPIYLFLAGGAILAIAAPQILRMARRLRATA
ncbi:MAG: hypothetical protein ACRDJF_12450, partial [Actinomycetota bacterium]